MPTGKRPRGRPRGSGKNDAPHLAQVADLLLCDPSLRPTTAMKRVIARRENWGATHETLLRCWQEKWKQQGQSFMAAARERASPKTVAAAPPSVSSLAGSPTVGTFADRLNSPAMRAFLDRERERMQAIKALAESPWMRAVRELENSPFMTALRKVQKQLENNPFWKMARDAQNAITPMMQAIRDLHNSPIAQAADQIAAYQRQIEQIRLIGRIP